MERLIQDTPKIKNLIVFLIFCVLIGIIYYFFYQENANLNAELSDRNSEINQLIAEIKILTNIEAVSTNTVINREINPQSCVEPFNPLIRDISVVQVTNSPSGISSDSISWKIWKINYWVAHNINYVSDPIEQDYFALASETILTRGGDCEDYAILLASMYESVGLDACLATIDTNEDKKPDHLSCLVYYPNTPADFLDDEKSIMKKLHLKSPTDTIGISHFKSDNFHKFPKYSSGIWIIIDPLAGRVIDIPGYIEEELSYGALRVIDVGG